MLQTFLGLVAVARVLKNQLIVLFTPENHGISEALNHEPKGFNVRSKRLTLRECISCHKLTFQSKVACTALRNEVIKHMLNDVCPFFVCNMIFDLLNSRFKDQQQPVMSEQYV